MNPNSILAFDAPNKTDAIIIQANKNIPYHAQNYIREKLHSEEPKDFLKFMLNAYGVTDFEKGKRDGRFIAGREYYTRMKAGNEWYNFTDEEIKDIIRYASSKKPKEIIEEISPGLGKGETDKRAAAAAALRNALNLEYLGASTISQEVEEVLSDGEYRAPQNDETVIKKINKCVPNAGWSKYSLDSGQKKCIKALKGHLGLLKYAITVQSYRSALDRQLFEAEFIRSCYDKPDMIPDDVNASMMLAQEYVRSVQIRSMMDMFDTQAKAAFEGENKALSMSFAENYNAKTKELKECQENIKSLQKTLNDSRTKRKEVESKYNDSIARYITSCCEESNRRALDNIAKAYKESVLKPEIDRLIETDQAIGEVHGISVAEVLGFTHIIN